MPCGNSRGNARVFTVNVTRSFQAGPGKTGSSADFTSLMDDLESRVFGELPDETWVYPGHGDDTTLGNERPLIQEWRTRGW